MAEKQAEKKDKNQSEAEFFALVSTGVKAVENIFDKYRPQLMQRAAKNIQGSFDVWASRTLFEISSNSELAGLLNTRPGIISAYKEITRAAVMGLMIGGKKPQAYFVPKGGKLVLIVDARGEIFCTVYGPGAVLAQVPELKKAYEGEDLRIDEASGTVTYPKDGRKMFPDGKVAGYFMELEYIDGRREVKQIPLAKVRKIQEHYGELGSPMYKKSPDEADEKTAIKYLLRMPFGEAEGIAMKRALGDEYEPPVQEPEPSKDVRDRVGARMEKVGTSVEAEFTEAESAEPLHPETSTGTKEAPKSATPAPAAPPAQPAPDKGDLF